MKKIAIYSCDELKDRQPYKRDSYQGLYQDPVGTVDDLTTFKHDMALFTGVAYGGVTDRTAH